VTDSPIPEPQGVSPIDAAVAEAVAVATALTAAWDKAVPTPGGQSAAPEVDNG
jgi:hypothetical protein